MRIRKFGHSCVLAETHNARVLIDPGALSSGFEALRGLTAIAFTHAHADHLDRGRVLALAEANRDCVVIADPGSVALLESVGIEAIAAGAGDVFDIGERLEVFGGDHAIIHDDIHRVPNIGYMFSSQFFHPGDALTVPACGVEILALPVVAPWMKISEGIDYLRRIRPAVAFPVHEAVASNPRAYYKYFLDLSPRGTRVAVIDDNAPGDV